MLHKIWSIRGGKIFKGKNNTKNDINKKKHKQHWMLRLWWGSKTAVNYQKTIDNYKNRITWINGQKNLLRVTSLGRSEGKWSQSRKQRGWFSPEYSRPVLTRSGPHSKCRELNDFYSFRRLNWMKYSFLIAETSSNGKRRWTSYNYNLLLSSVEYTIGRQKPWYHRKDNLNNKDKKNEWRNRVLFYLQVYYVTRSMNKTCILQLRK